MKKLIIVLVTGAAVLLTACAAPKTAEPPTAPPTTGVIQSVTTPVATIEAPAVVETPADAPPVVTPEPAQTCCKTCSTGKACGDGCIAESKTCSQPPGCACNAAP